MNQANPGLMKPLVFLLIACSLCAGLNLAWAQGECEGSGGLDFVCGPKNAEDLVQVPGTRWLIASGMASDAAIYLVDSQAKTWSEIYPSNEVAVQQNQELYGACPGAPVAEGFVSHGLNIQAGSAGHSTLFVVAHGSRESIEIFAVDASGDQPQLTWQGCVLMPDGQLANSVAALADGSLLVTVPVYGPLPGGEVPASKLTGGVFRWSPGDAGFTRVAGTDLIYANGIEVSADGQEFYVASSGYFNVVAFSNTNPATELRRTETFSIIPDNVHRSADGRLITVGMSVRDAQCGDIVLSEEIDIPKIASCPRPFSVLSIDPETMEFSVVSSSTANPVFSNATMALTVADEIWIGTFSGDRIAYRSLHASQP